MGEFYIGMLAVFGFEWAPVDFLSCNGQQLPVNQYQAVYALLGNTFGGTYMVNFNLPNLCGRNVVNQGVLPGWNTNFPFGAPGGAQNIQLSQAQMPIHTHAAVVSGGSGAGAQLLASTSPASHETAASGDYLAGTNLGGDAISGYVSAAGKGTTVPLGGVSGGGVSGASVTNASTGGGQAIGITNPYLVMNVCMMINGLWPARP